jgi:hypothetical protein
MNLRFLNGNLSSSHVFINAGEINQKTKVFGAQNNGIGSLIKRMN